MYSVCNIFDYVRKTTQLDNSRRKMCNLFILLRIDTTVFNFNFNNKTFYRRFRSASVRISIIFPFIYRILHCRLTTLTTVAHPYVYPIIFQLKLLLFLYLPLSRYTWCGGADWCVLMSYKNRTLKLREKRFILFKTIRKYHIFFLFMFWKLYHRDGGHITLL